MAKKKRGMRVNSGPDLTDMIEAIALLPFLASSVKRMRAFTAQASNQSAKSAKKEVLADEKDELMEMVAAVSERMNLGGKKPPIVRTATETSPS